MENVENIKIINAQQKKKVYKNKKGKVFKM